MHPRLLTLPGFDLFGRFWGPFILHTYGFLLALAFLAGLYVAARQAKRASGASKVCRKRGPNSGSLPGCVKIRSSSSRGVAPPGHSSR